MSTFAEKAMPYYEMGWPVIPQSRNKVPLISGWRSLKPSWNDILSWSDRYPTANVALVTGRDAGIFVIDLDNAEAMYRFNEIMKVCGLKLNAACVETRRGVHHYFRSIGVVKSQSPSKLGRGIDVRGDGGLATLPPSVHESGHVYRWVMGHPPAKLPLPSPAFLRMLAGHDPYRDERKLRIIDTSMTLDRAEDKLRHTGEGGRNRALYNASVVGGTLVRDKLMTEFEIYRRLQATAVAVGLNRIEIMRTIKSGLEDGQKLPSRRYGIG